MRRTLRIWALRGRKKSDMVSGGGSFDGGVNVRIEEKCGMEWKMSGGGEMQGRVLCTSADQVVSEIRETGDACKLKFCPSYSDAVTYGPKRTRRHSESIEAAKQGREVYLEFNLYTEGVGTQTALKRIANDLGVPLSHFSVASLKESHCVSTQLAAAKDVSWRQLSLVNDMFELNKDVKVGDFRTRTTSVGLGESVGSKVNYVIRNVDIKDGGLERLCQKVRRVRDNGFVNYLGYQRFSVGSVAQPYDIAVAMLKGDWRRGCEDLLRLHRKNDELLNYFVQNNYEGAITILEDVACPQRDMLIAMAQEGDPKKALLSSLPRSLRSFCFSSLQSYIWNIMASRRLRKGFTVLPGDLVMQDPEDYMEAHLIESETEARQYALKDVCMPMVGVMRDTEDNRPIPSSYPEVEGVNREAYESVLAERFGLSLSNFEEAAGSAAIFHGMFRPIWSDCSTLECYAMPAPDSTDTTPMLITDNMVMERTHFNLNLTAIVASEQFIAANPPTTPPHDSEFPFGANVILSATLPSSIYPAMLMRELVSDFAFRSAPVIDRVM
eukprot:TRINITY_DN38065_c0_g1_i1.p1 TRINITY_DN38065_c0_g1~~TRINITY_DN38065_c0_g1_i1.p1  ORF type:complete len:552 (+),score=53.17 TRINITY_DN38065_c0_g1_i1:37-1692(+)